MKVKFYNLKKIEVADGILKGRVELKGEPIGYATLMDGKLYIRVKDVNLKKILTQPYPVTIKEKGKGGAIYHKTINSSPSTEDHLAAVAGGCWQFGYIAEVVR